MSVSLSPTKEKAGSKRRFGGEAQRSVGTASGQNVADVGSGLALRQTIDAACFSDGTSPGEFVVCYQQGRGGEPMRVRAAQPVNLSQPEAGMRRGYDTRCT